MADSASLIGEELAHYRVIGKLGQGGMGAVYRAEDTRLGREVALKVLPEELAQEPERLARLRREAQILATLNHTNIASIYGLEEIDGRLILELELVEGEELAQRLKRGALPVDETIGERVTRLGKLPLAFQPGEQWAYSLSIDVLGRLLEVVSGLEELTEHPK